MPPRGLGGVGVLLEGQVGAPPTAATRAALLPHIDTLTTFLGRKCAAALEVCLM